MERRGFFIFGDVLACTTAGAAAGWLSWLAVPADWITPFWIGIGLILGMALGMIAGMTCGLLFMPFFGALEIVGSMLHPLPGVGAAEALSGGAVIGITCLTYTRMLLPIFLKATEGLLEIPAELDTLTGDSNGPLSRLRENRISRSPNELSSQTTTTISLFTETEPNPTFGFVEDPMVLETLIVVVRHCVPFWRV